MNVDNALAKSSIFSKILDGGDTGRRRVEHRNLLHLCFNQYSVSIRSGLNPNRQALRNVSN
jgi:hypothetical protein